MSIVLIQISKENYGMDAQRAEKLAALSNALSLPLKDTQNQVKNWSVSSQSCLIHFINRLDAKSSVPYPYTLEPV